MRSSTKWLIVLAIVICSTAASVPAVLNYRYQKGLYTLDPELNKTSTLNNAETAPHRRMQAYDTTVDIPAFRYLVVGQGGPSVSLNIDSSSGKENSQLIIDSSFRYGKEYLVKNDTLYLLSSLYLSDSGLYSSYTITLMPGRHLKNLDAEISGITTMSNQHFSKCRLYVNGNHFVKLDNNEIGVLSFRGEVPSPDATLTDLIIINNKTDHIDLNISSGYQFYFYDNDYKSINSSLHKDLLVYGYLREIKRM